MSGLRLYKTSGPVKDAAVGDLIQFPWRDNQEEMDAKDLSSKEKEAMREQVAAIVSGLRLVEPTGPQQLYDIKKSVLRLLILHFHWNRLRRSVWTATFHQQDSEMAKAFGVDPARVEKEDPLNILFRFEDENEMAGSWTYSGRKDEEDSGYEARYLIPAETGWNKLFQFLYLPPYTVSSEYRNVRWTSWRDTEEINTEEFVRFYHLMKGVSGGQADGQQILLLFFVQSALMDKNGNDVVFNMGFDNATSGAIFSALEKNRYNFDESSNTDAMWRRRTNLISSWAVIMQNLLVVAGDKRCNSNLSCSDLLPDFHAAKPAPLTDEALEEAKADEDEDEDE